MQTYNPYKMFVGSFIPNWLMERKEVSPGAKLCFSRLAQYAGKNGKAYPSQETLADAIGTSSRNVRNYLNELKKHGLIRVTQNGLNKPNSYDFIVHNWMTGGTEEFFHTGTEESFLLEWKNPSTQDRQNPSYKENQTRESVKRNNNNNVAAVSSLLNLIPKGNQAGIQSLIESRLKKFNQEHIKRNILYALNHNPKDLKKYISVCIEYNYADGWEPEELKPAKPQKPQKPIVGILELDTATSFLRKGDVAGFVNYVKKMSFTDKDMELARLKAEKVQELCVA